MRWTDKKTTGGFFVFTYYNDDQSRIAEAIGISRALDYVKQIMSLRRITCVS
jgi:hypothetical protein